MSTQGPNRGVCVRVATTPFHETAALTIWEGEWGRGAGVLFRKPFGSRTLASPAKTAGAQSGRRRRVGNPERRD